MVKLNTNNSAEDILSETESSSSGLSGTTLQEELDKIRGHVEEPAHSVVDTSVLSSTTLPSLLLPGSLQKLFNQARNQQEQLMSPVLYDKDRRVFTIDSSNQELAHSKDSTQEMIRPISNDELMSFMSVEKIRESEIPYDRIQETINRMKLQTVTPELVVVMAVLESEGLDIAPIWDQIAEDGSIVESK